METKCHEYLSNCCETLPKNKNGNLTVALMVKSGYKKLSIGIILWEPWMFVVDWMKVVGCLTDITANEEDEESVNGSDITECSWFVAYSLCLLHLSAVCVTHCFGCLTHCAWSQTRLQRWLISKSPECDSVSQTPIWCRDGKTHGKSSWKSQSDRLGQGVPGGLSRSHMYGCWKMRMHSHITAYHHHHHVCRSDECSETASFRMTVGLVLKMRNVYVPVRSSHAYTHTFMLVFHSASRS